MDLKNWYDRVREQLDRLDFPALWAGFAPCPFALYTHDTAVLNGEVMPRPAEFYGNTSVCRQGEHLAIWNMEADPPADVAGLAASLVHEMFHSFQFRCGEQGWPDDLVLAATEPQPAFLALRAQEHRALAGGAPLSEVLALRQSRAALQPELLLEEARMETIEGTAEYVGRLALARLSPAACEGAYARSAQRLPQWPDLRRGAYDSGPWLLRRAAEEGLPMPVHPGGEPIADQLARQLSLPEVRLQPELLAEAERRLERERPARRVTLQTLLETAERTEGDFAVCGYDPMQLRAQDGLLWSGSFLALRQADGTVRRLFGPCAVQLADDPHRATALFVPRMRQNCHLRVTGPSPGHGKMKASNERKKISMDLLTVEHLTKTYGTGENAVHALDDVSFSVPRGQFLAIIGPSGSGKSTLLHILGGVDRPTSGHVYMNGEDVYSRSDTALAIFRRREVGLIYQFYNLIPVLNVVENITLPVLMDGRKVNDARLQELLDTLGLRGREKHLPNQLSGGQQQRVSIGRALINAPSVVLADEPTGNLDRKNSQEIVELLKYSNRQYGQTLIVITHDESIALQADRVLAIEDGHIVRDEVIRK